MHQLPFTCPSRIRIPIAQSYTLVTNYYSYLFMPVASTIDLFYKSICFTQGTLFMLQRSLHNPLRCSLRISTDLAPSSDVCLALYQLNPSFIMDLITPPPPLSTVTCICQFLEAFGNPPGP